MCNSSQRRRSPEIVCCTKLSPKDGVAMDLDSFLVSLYVLVDDWWKLECSSEPPKTGRPALLSDSEVITLAFPQPSGLASAARGTSCVSLGRTCAPTSLP